MSLDTVCVSNDILVARLGGGLLVAFGLVFGVVGLARRGAQSRVRGRVAAVAAAAPPDGDFSIASLTAVGHELFGRFLPAWAARDLDGLGELGDAQALADASVRVGRGQPHIKAGPLLSGPQIAVVGPTPTGRSRAAGTAGRSSRSAPRPRRRARCCVSRPSRRRRLRPARTRGSRA